MTKTDILFSLIIGSLVAFLFNGSVSALNIKDERLWYAFVIIPLSALSGILISSLIGRKIPVIYQLAKFLLVGTLNTMVDLGVLNFLMASFSTYTGFSFGVFKGFSFLAAATNSYLWNKIWTFQKKESVFEKKEYLKFLLVASGGFSVNVGTAVIMVNIIRAPSLISEKTWANVSAITAVIISVIWNFVGSKFIVFKK